MAAGDEVRDGQTALALRLIKHLSAAAGKNVAFSPVSVHAGLALVAAGAGGATQAQLLNFLGAPTADGLAAFGRLVADRILADQADSDGPRVLFGGGVWVDASRGGLNKAFKEVAAKSYKSETGTVSFTDEPEEAVETINRWVKKATDNLIDSMISRSNLNADTDLVLANAVYFKGSWLAPFNVCYTMPGKFHLLDGSQVEAKFMHKNKVDGMATMVDVITAAPGYLYSVLPTETKVVKIALPKFEVSLDWDLGSDLRRLELTLPFSREVGDLRGMYTMDDGRPTFLTKVAHKAVIKVNEEGTETTAVMMAVRGGGAPDHVEFVADHPFTFLIMEERSGVIVFAGHVLDPTSK